MATPRLTVAELRSADRVAGEEFEAVLVLRKVASRTARNDNNYLVVELGDRGGSFNANIFSDNALNEVFRTAPEGRVVLITARVDFYQGRFSPKLLGARLLEDDELESLGGIDSLVESAPESLASLHERLRALIGRIGHEPLRRTVETAFDLTGPAFLTSPAAVSMHHAYRSGLLEHTVHVAEAGAVLLPLYPEVCADLAIAGALLHDIGKTVEYEGALAPRKSRSGILNGHVVLGYRVVRRAGLAAKLEPDLLERLEHIVLSHQGELEWGAATMAATPEAVFVSLIDNLDAKLGMVQRALRGADESVFSEYLPGLKTALLRARPVFQPPAAPAEPPVEDAPPADAQPASGESAS